MTAPQRLVSAAGVAAAVLCLLAGCEASPGGEAERRQAVHVYAAASLTDALEALADSFEAAHPQYNVVLSVAATSLLARQIGQGAPADVFFAAHPAWMAFLEERGRVAGSVRYPIGNTLVVAGRSDAPPLDTAEALMGVKRLALADPEQVPAGLYAEAALRCSGLWDAVQKRVVPTLDVRAALLAVQSGAAEAALVYATDARVAAGARVLLEWPAACQPRIRYAVARTRNAEAPRGAAAFVDFVTDPARAIFWAEQGFVPPAEAQGRRR